MTAMETETPVAPAEAPRGMFARIVALLIHPRSEWARIDCEPASVRGLMLGWVVPLAAIGPVAKLIGGQFFTYTNDGAQLSAPLMTALTEAVISYGLSVAGLYLLSRLINGLATSFKGRRDPVAAMKVAAYAATPVFLVGIFEIVHALQWLEIAGLYSLYLLFVGLPAVMHAPRKRILVYILVTMMAGIAMAILFNLVVMATKGMFTPSLPDSAWNYTPPK